ncbi:cache domain-containing protein [Streptomyces sp. NPDC048636]|uniref:cache domain-containing protein n=1 Tax=Streptomyces sp. NPDC048636 TaxID=3155762 RepID=UPI003437BAB7
MGSSPRPAGAGPDLLVTAADVAARVRDTLEGVFDAVRGISDDAAALLTSVGGGGQRPVTNDLAELRPGLQSRLTRLELVSGAGFVAAPHLLADASVWLEWWQIGAGGEVRPLLLDLDPEHSAYSDYTHWDWFALARDTGRRAVAGPYVDYLCSDEYSLTLSVPVTVDGRFMGVAAADVYLSHFEAAVMPVMQRLPAPAFLVNARGRVAASTCADYLTGALFKGPDFAAVPTGPAEGVEYGGRRLRPCGDIPLILVTNPGAEDHPGK